MDKYLLKPKTPQTTPPPNQIIPPETTTLTPTEQAYINSLSPKELNAYKIAKKLLKTSFTLSKSQGYHHYRNNLS
jgi:hypothetical protein